MDTPPSSRLIIKNLPFSENEKTLSKTFSQKGELTDCRVMKRKDGKSRGFAYIGYKTIEEATAARNYFNNSFVGMRKVSVEFARPIGTPELENTYARRKMHQHEQRKQEQKIERTKKVMEKKGIDESDPKWLEFLAAQVKHDKRQSWNDGVMFDDRVKEPEPAKPEEEEDKLEDNKEEEEKKEEPVLTTNTRRLYVINIPYTSTAEEVKAEFEKFGEVEDVHLQAADIPGENSGAGYVKFADIESAKTALNTAIIMMGRHLKLKPSLPEPEKKKESVFEDDDMSFKDKKAARLRQNTPENYNPFFMNKDTIADAIAARIGVTRADVLNPESDDAASRLAVAESQLVEETKALFLENGIDPEKVTQKVEVQSLTVLLVKNLRWETTEEELRGMFAAKGTLVRFVLAPTHTIAIVEYAKPDEARRARDSLNMRLLHDNPLLIQMAPEGCTTGPGLETDERSSRRPRVEVKTTTLIVKNLPFEAKKADVRNVCSTYGNIKAIRMSKKPDGSGHRGFCFLDYATRQEAQTAHDSLQNVHLLGRHLIVQPAAEGKNEETKTQKEGSLGDIITKTKKRRSDDVDDETPKATVK